MSQQPSGLSPSLVRTLVPFIVGPLVAVFGTTASDPKIVALVSALIGYGYYAAARAAEVFLSPRWGYVLGIAKSPAYSPEPPPQAEPEVVPDDDTPDAPDLTDVPNRHIADADEDEDPEENTGAPVTAELTALGWDKI